MDQNENFKMCLHDQFGDMFSGWVQKKDFHKGKIDR